VSFPTVVVSDNRCVVGYKPEKLEEALGLRAKKSSSLLRKLTLSVFVWTAVFERSRWKYRQRAYRYVYLDAGHIAQNVALGAVALGLGSCQIAALYDDEVNGLLDVDGVDESAIYMTVVGKPK